MHSYKVYSYATDRYVYLASDPDQFSFSIIHGDDCKSGCRGHCEKPMQSTWWCGPVNCTGCHNFIVNCLKLVVKFEPISKCTICTSLTMRRCSKFCALRWWMSKVSLYIGYLVQSSYVCFQPPCWYFWAFCRNSYKIGAPMLCLCTFSIMASYTNVYCKGTFIIRLLINISSFVCRELTWFQSRIRTSTICQ